MASSHVTCGWGEKSKILDHVRSSLPTLRSTKKRMNYWLCTFCTNYAALHNTVMAHCLMCKYDTV